jgi:RimJ/RimL family protein N-acetyltransferase
MIALESSRLRLRPLTLADAPFILELVNEPAWRRFIGDKGIRDLDAARAYLTKGVLELYARHDLGPLGVAEKNHPALIGICGLIKRPALADVDLGFAFLSHAQGRGFATEAAEAVLAATRGEGKWRRVVALTTVDNDRSARLLERLGFRFERLIQITAEAPMSKLFALSLAVAD